MKIIKILTIAAEIAISLVAMFIASSLGDGLLEAICFLVSITLSIYAMCSANFDIAELRSENNQN